LTYNYGMTYYSDMEWTLKLRKVPETLPQRTKIAAAMSGQSLQDFIIDLLSKASKDVKLPKK
jgi:uncharacterized protein (DUF1778 family)